MDGSGVFYDWRRKKLTCFDTPHSLPNSVRIQRDAVMIHWNSLVGFNLVGNQVKYILFLYLDQRDGHWTQPSQYRDPEFHATPVVTVVTFPVPRLSCKQTPHLNLLQPHSLLFTCTLHGHPDLPTPYLPTARLCRDTGEARPALWRCMVPLENLTAKRNGVSPRRRREEWRTMRDGPEELICGLGCEQRHTANYWTRAA